MKHALQIMMNESLFLRNPDQSDLGKNIIKHSIQLIHEQGFESFTFKKLAKEIGTTEAGVYRYFENKHKLLVYLTTWYWGWLEFQISFNTNNIEDPHIKLKRVIKLLSENVKDDESTSHINEALLHQIVISEGSKAYLTSHVDNDNQQQLFKPYKDLCKTIGDLILEFNPNYKYSRSLASTIIEMAHLQNYFMNHLPSLTDFAKTKSDEDVYNFIHDLVFSSIKK